MPSHDPDASDPRRRLLLQALAAGVLAGTGGRALADTFGARPRKLPEGRNIFELTGTVRVNGQRAGRDTRIAPGDVIETGDAARLVFVMDADALIVRANTRLEVDGAAGAARRFFRLVNGAMLAVFGKRADTYEIRTPTATLGIRGTGAYTEADADKSYVCLCYGSAELASAAAPERVMPLTSTHHDAPKWLYREPLKGELIAPAPFINHTDLELMALEALVGRTVPFWVPDDPYASPRREY
jgi:hypothetical protein